MEAEMAQNNLEAVITQNEQNSDNMEGETQENSTPESEDKPLSKNQLKKQKRLAKFEEIKKWKKAKDKEKRKALKREMKERGEVSTTSRKRWKNNKMKDSPCKVKVAVDCSFDDFMEIKDIMKMGQQLQYSYSSNRRAENPLQLYATSFGGKTKARLTGIGEYKYWDMNFTEGDYISEFGAENVVYLSSDSPNLLQTLDDTKAYIIGGLVDHNHHKGLCHRLALEKGISHAQLPIEQYLEMKTRKVLTVNHVFEILLRFTETSDWEEAFFKVIPKRKDFHTKTDASCTLLNENPSSPNDDSKSELSKDNSTKDDPKSDLSKNNSVQSQQESTLADETVKNKGEKDEKVCDNSDKICDSSLNDKS